MQFVLLGKKFVFRKFENNMIFINILAGITMEKPTRQFFNLFFNFFLEIAVFCTIINVVTEAAELSEESSIIVGETTDVIETDPANELKEDGKDILESALELVGSIISNWFAYDINEKVEGKNRCLIFIQYETDIFHCLYFNRCL